MKRFKMALIGVGARGEGLYRVALKQRGYVDFIAVCDSYADRCETLAEQMVKDGRPRPACYTDYRRCIEECKPDCILVSTSWKMHIEITMYAMKRGIAVACEVGGAYDLDSLWALVRCYEETKTPVMMMENCCYGRLELLALEMKRRGLLGEIVHCEGGYRHDLREEVTTGKEKRHYRLQEYIQRNCENYPTHEIGPIAKILDINRGNRFVSLYSMASKSVGLADYVQKHDIEHLRTVQFRQSDVVTTLIRCANGETVTITLDTTLPRYYSRGFLVQGTEGLICEENQSVFLEKDCTGEHWDWTENFGNIHKYYERYDHPIWKDYHPGAEGHGGMDALVFDAFFEALDGGKPMPIDVYDMATWMAISALSEESIVTGKEVAFPDFTNGKWQDR